MKEQLLEIRNLTKNYGKFRALNGFNMKIKEGDLFGFVGPNGAGKTTTIKIIAGLLKADAGQIFLEGNDLIKDTAVLKENIGYVPDYFGVYDNLKTLEYMEFYASTYGLVGGEVKALCLELLEIVGLEGKENQYVDALSRGMQQRLCLARALVHNPKLLILDEPASGLDPSSRVGMKNILMELAMNGKTILISSHILSELSEMCSSIGIIQKGEMILQGSIEEIVSSVNTMNPLMIHVLEGREDAVLFLRTHPLVKTLAISGNEFQIIFEGDAKEEAYLLQEMIERNLQVISFGRKKDNLESIYMKITKEGEEKNVSYQSGLSTGN
ncbi:MAG: ABC transporter ATP-binding protein [Lachnospiraceae bacterium]|nr:ABC transporter ATP-binding protein [Lachnospiraceae bacterium]